MHFPEVTVWRILLLSRRTSFTPVNLRWLLRFVGNADLLNNSIRIGLYISLDRMTDVEFMV